MDDSTLLTPFSKARVERYDKQGTGNAYATLPDRKWTLEMYFTIHGLENLLLYVWIAKDLSWTTSSWVGAWFWGILAIVLSLLFVVRAVVDVNWLEIWHGIAQFLWVFGNFWWMIGDVHDVEFPDRKSMYDERQKGCQHIMEAALIWLALWYLIVRPLKLLPEPDEETARMYDEHDLVPSIPYFKTWRTYESFHIVLWLGKDYAWNTLNKPLWFIFTPFTLIASMDFIWTTARVDNMIIDHVHYISMLMWVIGNMMWALGELFYASDDDPEQLLRGSRPENKNCRWWASWCLIWSFLPLLVLHCVWIPLTLAGKLDHLDEAHAGTVNRMLRLDSCASDGSSDGASEGSGAGGGGGAASGASRSGADSPGSQNSGEDQNRPLHGAPDSTTSNPILQGSIPVPALPEAPRPIAKPPSSSPPVGGVDDAAAPTSAAHGPDSPTNTPASPRA